MKPVLKWALAISLALVAMLAAVFSYLGDRRGDSPATLMARGRHFAETGDYRRSVEAFREAARRAPGSLDAHYGLALAMMQTGNPAEAQLELYRVVQRNEEYRDARVQLAKLMVRRPSLEDAQWGADWAEKELAAAPQGAHAADAHYAVAISLMRHEKVDDSVDHLRTALRLNPAHVDSAAALAILLLIRGNQPAAEAALLALPATARSEQALGEFYRLTGRPATSYERFRHALQMGPGISGAAVNLCDTAFLLRTDLSQCAQPLERLRDSGPPEFQHLHGLFLLRTGHPVEGLAELAEVYGKDPADLDARSRWLAALVAAGRHQEAERALDGLIAGNRSDARALAERGHLRLLRGDRAAGAADIETAMSFDPQRPEVRYEKALLEYALGNRIRSEYEISEAAHFDPSFLPARLDWARELIAEGKPTLARDVIDGTPVALRAAPVVLAAREWSAQPGSPLHPAGEPFRSPGLRSDLLEYPTGPVYQVLDLDILIYAQASPRQRWLVF